MMNFTPDGTAGEFFAVLAPHAPAPPPGADPPLRWGGAHVRSLFGDRVAQLTMTRHTYVERAPDAQAYCRLVREAFGPVVAIRASLGNAPEQRATLDRALLEAGRPVEPEPSSGSGRDPLPVSAGHGPHT